mgnify:CR=1 FL=1
MKPQKEKVSAIDLSQFKDEEVNPNNKKKDEFGSFEEMPNQVKVE